MGKIMIFSLLLLIIMHSQACMVKVIPPNIYYCDAVTYPCLTGSCITIPLDGGLVRCLCQNSLITQ